MLKEKEKFMGQAVLHYQKNGKSSGFSRSSYRPRRRKKNIHIGTPI